MPQHPGRFVRGSAAAKEHMARLRSMRGKNKGNGRGGRLPRPSRRAALPSPQDRQQLKVSDVQAPAGGAFVDVRSVRSAARKAVGGVRRAVNVAATQVAGATAPRQNRRGQMTPQDKRMMATHFMNLKRHAKSKMLTATPQQKIHLKRIIGHRGHLKAAADFASEPRGGGFWSTLRNLFKSAPDPIDTFREAVTKFGVGSDVIHALPGGSLPVRRGPSRRGRGRRPRARSAAATLQQVHGPPRDLTQPPVRR